jgi:hypothetical protein
MPTDIAVAIMRKREAVPLERKSLPFAGLSYLLPCRGRPHVSPTFACAVELLVDY